MGASHPLLKALGSHGYPPVDVEIRYYFYLKDEVSIFWIVVSVAGIPVLHRLS
jgi:hypothetical protein